MATQSAQDIGRLKEALLPYYKSAAWIRCAVCLEEFPFTEEERNFFLLKNLKIQPKRCKACRHIRRATQKGEKLYPVICGKCGRKTKVSFEPNPLKDIFCADCLVALKLLLEKQVKVRA